MLTPLGRVLPSAPTLTPLTVVSRQASQPIRRRSQPNGVKDEAEETIHATQSTSWSGPDPWTDSHDAVAGVCRTGIGCDKPGRGGRHVPPRAERTAGGQQADRVRARYRHF